MDRIELPPKAVSEVILVQFDFTNLLPAGAVLVNSGVRVVVLSGTDASPSSILSGGAAISGNIVSQIVQAGIAGVTYELVCAATTISLGLMKNAYLSIIPGFSDTPLTPPTPPPPTCTILFDKWVIWGGYSYGGTWDPDGGVWTPGEPMTSQHVSGDSLDFSTFIDGFAMVPILSADDLPDSGSYVNPGFMVPEGSLEFSAFALGELCDTTATAGVALGEAPTGMDATLPVDPEIYPVITLVWDHPLDSALGPGEIFVANFTSQKADTSEWGPPFTIYILSATPAEV